jgi:hypothetical protein
MAKLNQFVSECRVLLGEVYSAETCEEVDCDHPVDCRRMCKKHYRIWRREACKRLGVTRLKDAPTPTPIAENEPMLPFPTPPESAEDLGEISF